MGATAATPTDRQGRSARYGVGMLTVLGFLFGTTAIHINPLESSMPGMAKDLGGSANSTAMVASAFFFGMMLGHLIIGPISDIIGRKRTVLAGLLILMIGAGICAGAQSLLPLVIGRAIQGVGGAGVLCTGRAIGGDAGVGRASARTLSMMEIIAATIAIFMPLLGNTIAELSSWRAVFVMMIVLDVILAIGLMALVKETARPVKGANTWKSLIADLRASLVQPDFMLLVLAFGFGIATFFCYAGASAFVFMNELGLTRSTYAALYSGLGVTMVIGGFIATWATRRHDPPTVFRATVAVQFACAATIVILFATGTANVVWVAACFGIIAGGNAVALPVGLALALNTSGRVKGSAAALCGFAQYGFSWVTTTLLSFVRDDQSIGLMTGLAMCVTASLAFLLCWAATVRTRRVMSTG
jgi:MFS transporter, DHA1 family, multidrug resistance protein